MDGNRTQLAIPRLALLFWIFFLIACGLGYPVLNRFDPRQTPGLSDVKTYASLATGAAILDPEDMRFRRFRVLVPWIASLFTGSREDDWNLGSGDVGLLVSDSLFVAGTAVLIVMLGAVLWKRQTASLAVGLVGALLYLVNFAVPNAGWLGWSMRRRPLPAGLTLELSESKLWVLPVIAVLEPHQGDVRPVSIVLTTAWWFSTGAIATR